MEINSKAHTKRIKIQIKIISSCFNHCTRLLLDDNTVPYVQTPRIAKI